MADFILGEYGDPLRVAMPFDATAATVVVEVRIPGLSWAAAEPAAPPWVTIAAPTIAGGYVEFTIPEGLLAVAGTYRGRVTATFAGPPERARIAKFTFSVEG